MKKIIKKQELIADNCKICKKEISGYSEAQVNSRMEMHMKKHRKDKK